MAEVETSTPEPGPASAPAAITLDGVLESAINGESIGGEAGPTPRGPIALAGETTSAEDVEVDSDPSDQAAEGQQDADAEATPDTDTPESDAEPEPDALAAPKTWPTEHREAFEHLPETQQQFMLQREQERDAAFTRKTTELAEQRREVEGVAGVLAPYKEQMRSHGISEAEYISRLMTYDSALRQNPKAAIAQLAQHYNIDLSNDSSGDWVDENPPDPQFQQLQHQLNQTNAELKSIKQGQIQREQHQVTGQVENFATEKDSKGNLKRPHFEAVRERMGRLVTAEEITDLQSAYDMAVRMDDTLYKQSLQAERQSVAKQEDSRRKAAVDKAKKAAPGRTSGSPPSGTVRDSDLDALLRNSIGEARAG
tara:strand:- start:618 stop:1721 length:1104 start_codon:yes stop_codon:yes gene_type:complete